MLFLGEHTFLRVCRLLQAHSRLRWSSSILPREHAPAKIVGVVMGVAGVGVIFSNQLSVAGPRALAGCAALVIGSACAAYANVLVKARGAKLDPAILAGGQMFFGLIPLLLIGIPLEGNPLLRWT